MKKFLLLLCFLAAPAFAVEKVSMVFEDVRLVDLLRVAYTEITKQSFVFCPELIQAEKLYSVDLHDLEPQKATAAVRQLAESAGFVVRFRDGVVWVDKQDQAEDQELIVYKPRFRSAQYLADVVQSITGARSVLARSIRSQRDSAQPVQNVQQSSMDQNAQPVNVDPSSVYGQIDRSEVDQIAFAVSSKEIVKVQKLLSDLDTQAGEVLLKVAVYEVNINESKASAFKLAASILGGKLGLTIAGNVLDGTAINIKTGSLDAVLSALDADSRFKSISRPRVRVKNGSKAVFNVGQDVPVLGTAQIDRSGNPVQSIEYKQSGIILSASPQIRQDIIEVDLHQELSNFVITKTGVNGSPTLIKRSVNTVLSLKTGEVVILAGLQDDQQNAMDNRLPFVGWLLGQDRQTQQSEILVFLEAETI